MVGEAMLSLTGTLVFLNKTNGIFFCKSKLTILKRKWLKPEFGALFRSSRLSNFQFWTCTLSSLHLCICVCLITAICAHIPVLYIISTHLRPMMPKHSNAASISIETGSWPMRGAVNIFAVVMETRTVFTGHLLGLNFYLLHACVWVRRVVGGLTNINTSSILWHSQCGAVGGEGMLQQTLGCRGCGRERIWRWHTGLGEVSFQWLFVLVWVPATRLNSATKPPAPGPDSGEAAQERSKMSLLFLKDCLLFFHIFF